MLERVKATTQSDTNDNVTDLQNEQNFINFLSLK